MRLLLRITLIATLITALAALFVSCPGGGQKAGESSTEKTIENASGGRTDVDMSKNGVTVTDKETGDTLVVFQDGELPDYWPSDIPQYPGSTIVSSSMQTVDNDRVTTVTMTSSDDKYDTAGFYMEKLQIAGFQLGESMEIMGNITHSFKGRDREVIVTAMEAKDGGSELRLMLVETDKGTANVAEDGESAEVVMVGDRELVAGFPVKTLSPYPGAELLSSEDDGKYAAMILETEDNVDLVRRYYEKHFKDLGWKETYYDNQPASVDLEYEGAKGIASVSAISAAGVTEITLELERTGDQTSGDGGPAEDGATGYVDQLPAEWPVKVIPPYPNATIDEVLISEGSYTLGMTAGDPADEVIKFYTGHLVGRGWMALERIDISETETMITYTSTGGKVTLVCTEDEAWTAVVVNYTKPVEEGTGGGMAFMDGDTSYASNKLPAGFPTDVVPVYPGSTIQVATVNSNTATLLQDMEDSMDKVRGFYDKFYKGKGWQAGNEFSMNGMTIYEYSKGGQMVGVTLQVQDDGLTFISLVYTW